MHNAHNRETELEALQNAWHEAEGKKERRPHVIRGNKNGKWYEVISFQNSIEFLSPFRSLRFQLNSVPQLSQRIALLANELTRAIIINVINNSLWPNENRFGNCEVIITQRKVF